MRVIEINFFSLEKNLFVRFIKQFFRFNLKKWSVLFMLLFNMNDAQQSILGVLRIEIRLKSFFELYPIISVALETISIEKFNKYEKHILSSFLHLRYTQIDHDKLAKM